MGDFVDIESTINYSSCLEPLFYVYRKEGFYLCLVGKRAGKQNISGWRLLALAIEQVLEQQDSQFHSFMTSHPPEIGGIPPSRQRWATYIRKSGSVPAFQQLLLGGRDGGGLQDALLYSTLISHFSWHHITIRQVNPAYWLNISLNRFACHNDRTG